MTEKERRNSYWDAKIDPYQKVRGYDEYVGQRRLEEASKKADEVAAWNRLCDIMSGTGIVRTVKVDK